MENGYKLFDYDVGLNDIIQLLERKIETSEGLVAFLLLLVLNFLVEAVNNCFINSCFIKKTFNWLSQRSLSYCLMISKNKPLVLTYF